MPIIPMTPAQAAVARLIETCSRDPYWMADVKAWNWKRADGAPQGFGLASPDPGLSNLLWLSMDLDHPPARYDAVTNPLYMSLFLAAHLEHIGPRTLVDHAGLLTLAQFEDLLPSSVSNGTTLERAYPLLKRLAQRRLNANT